MSEQTAVVHRGAWHTLLFDGALWVPASGSTGFQHKEVVKVTRKGNEGIEVQCVAVGLLTPHYAETWVPAPDEAIPGLRTDRERAMIQPKENQMGQTKTEKKVELEKARVRQDLMKLTKTQIIDQLFEHVASYAAERAAYEGRIRRFGSAISELEGRIKTHTENWSSLRSQLDRERASSKADLEAAVKERQELRDQMMSDRERYEADRNRLDAALDAAHRDLEQKGRDFEILATAFEAVNRHYTERD